MITATTQDRITKAVKTIEKIEAGKTVTFVHKEDRGTLYGIVKESSTNYRLIWKENEKFMTTIYNRIMVTQFFLEFTWIEI